MARQTYNDDNLKVNEFLHRRADIEDIVSAHLIALDKAADIGFGRYIVSASTPFSPQDLRQLRVDAATVVRRSVPQYETEYARRGWSMLPVLDRVYVNERARAELGWRPRHDFRSIIERLRRDEDPRSPLARAIGCKGYHGQVFADGPYPTE